MSKSADEMSTAAHATSERFLSTVMGDDRRYPNGSEFVTSDMPRLDDIISRKIREGRATVIVHDDGSDIVIEPRPDMTRLTLAGVLLLGALLRHVKPTVEAGGEVIQLPAATRVRLHPPSAIAA
jgi:hypothetical protein